MTDFLNYILSKSSHFRNIGELVLTRALVILIGAVATVWAARCLGSEQLGVSASIQNIFFQLVFLIHLNQDTSLLRIYKLTPSDDARQEIINAFFTFRLVTAAALLLLLATITSCTNLNFLPIAFAEPISHCGFFLLLSGSLTYNWIFFAQERQLTDLRMAALNASILALLCLLFIRPNATASDYLTTVATSQTITMLTAWRLALRSHARPKMSIAAFKNYLRFLVQGKWILLIGLFSVLYGYSAPPILSALVSPSEAGIYRAAEQAAGTITPFFAIASSLLFPKYLASAQLPFGQLWEQQKLIFQKLTFLSSAILILAALSAPAVLPTIFGSEFSRSAMPFVLLVAARCANMLGGIFTWALYARHHDRLILIFTILAAFFSLLANFSLAPTFGVNGVTAVTLLTELVLALLAFNSCRLFAKTDR